MLSERRAVLRSREAANVLSLLHLPTATFRLLNELSIPRAQSWLADSSHDAPHHSLICFLTTAHPSNDDFSLLLATQLIATFLELTIDRHHANGNAAHLSLAMASTVTQPAVLPCTIVAYDGGVQEGADDEVPIEHVLDSDRRAFHCSKPGRNFNLLLQYKPDGGDNKQTATLTHIVIRGPNSCTCPIATGVVFASLDKPDIASYTGKYDNMTREQYDALNEQQKRADGAVSYFATTQPHPLEMVVSLPTWLECRYVHIKLIAGAPEDSVEPDEANVDLERVALVGYSTEQARLTSPTAISSTLLHDLNLLDEPLLAWNALSEKHYAYIDRRAACILFLADTTQADTIAARNCIKAIADSNTYQPKLMFFHLDASNNTADPDYLTYVGRLTGLDVDELKKAADTTSNGGMRRATLVITTTSDHSNSYHYEPLDSDTFDNDGVRRWLDKFFAGGLQRYVKSQPRPVNDIDPKHPGIVQLTAHTWDKLVTNSSKDVLVVLVNEHRDNTILASGIVRKWIHTLADVLPAHPNLLLATFDTHLNCVRDKGLPTAMPETMLYRVEDKTEPVHSQAGTENERALFEWLSDQLPSLQLDVDELSSRDAVKECVVLCRHILSFMMGPAEAFNSVMGGLQPFMSEEDRARLIACKDNARQYAVQLATTLQLDDLTVQQLEAASQQVYDECKRYQQAVIAVKLSQVPIELALRDLKDAGRRVNKRDRTALREAVAELQALLQQDDDDEEEKAEEEEEDEVTVEEFTERAAADTNVEADAAVADVEMSDRLRREDEIATKVTADRPEELDAGTPAAAAELIHKLRVARMKLIMRYAKVAAVAGQEREKKGALQDKNVKKCHSAADFHSYLDLAKAVGKLCVVDFTASWCGPCKQVRPLFGQLSEQYDDVMFLKVDVDDCEEVSAEFSIVAMPTFVFIRDGKELEGSRVQGVNVKALTGKLNLLKGEAEASRSQAA